MTETSGRTRRLSSTTLLVSSVPPRRLFVSRRERRSRRSGTLIGAEVVAEDSEAAELVEAEVVEEDAEVVEGEEAAGMKTTPTTPSLVTEAGGQTGGGTDPRAHLLEGSRQEDSPPGPIIPTGGTGPGLGTGTVDPAHPPTTGSRVRTTGSPVPMTGLRPPLMIGLRHQAGLHPPMTGHLRPAELIQLTTGQLPRPADLPHPMTGPPQTLRAEAPHPMTGRRPTLRAGLPRLTTGPAPPLTTGGRRRPPG